MGGEFVMLALYMSTLPDQSYESKFEKFYLEYKQILLKVAYDHIHDTYLAEDCVHEVLLYISEHFDRIGEIKSSATQGYVMTITHAYANRFYNAKTKEVYLEDLFDEPEAGIDYADVAFNELDLGVVAECIKNLKDPYREVFILRIYHDLDFCEIAEITGLTEAYVRKVLERARKKLNKELKNRKEEISGDRIAFE